MKTATLASNGAAPRMISHRTGGHPAEPVTRLMSPSDLGQRLKPFVFLDLFDMRGPAPSFALHPHSGIATVTVMTDGPASFDDPVLGSGIIGYGGVEWMRAGGGVWYGTEMVLDAQHTRGFQLWVALPPELENTAAESQLIKATYMPAVGPVCVILGSHEGVQSPVRSPAGMTYFLVTLKAGERWQYAPPQGMTSRGWQSAPAPCTQARLCRQASLPRSSLVPTRSNCRRGSRAMRCSSSDRLFLTGTTSWWVVTPCTPARTRCGPAKPASLPTARAFVPAG